MAAEAARVSPIYGLVAEFDNQDDILAAAAAARKAGYKRMDCYTPFPVHGLTEAMEFEDARVPWTIFIGGLTGMCVGYGLQFWINCIEYPLNVGGRPYHSWPSFIPVTFECIILFAALTAVLTVLGYSGLPRPYHPVFNTPNFETASQYHFFLAIEARDAHFDIVKTREFLESLHPLAVSEVEK
ncbi:MAG TPA: DUF3341 domain-containing protein [Chthonomonadaceae bacterium]|nr:DUF3341 domain-containing protein [Chthonomonadaceae bacterium]